MLAACTGGSRALGEGIFGALELLYVPLKLIDVALKHVQSLQTCRKLAAVLGQKLRAPLVSGLVLRLEPDDSCYLDRKSVV